MISLLFPLIGVIGCKSPCQSLCDEMANYADDCGFTYSDEELTACYEDNGRRVTSDESQDACRAYSDDLQSEWTCDDLAIYFDGGGGGGGGGSKSTGR